MLELHPTFVAVKLDLRNAYNAVSRQVVLRRLAAVPSLSHLVPFIHALWASPSDLVTDRTGSRLFEGERGDSSEGVQQGMALASLAFAVAMHPELVALDRELASVGGCARAIMDDVYAVGPASAVFSAIERFAESLEQMTGLEMVQRKLGCYSPQYDLESCPWRIRSQTPLGTSQSPEGDTLYGITVGNVPSVRG